MIIDSHQHVFWHGRNDQELIDDMTTNGIDHSWLLTWEIPLDHDDKIYHSVLNPLHLRSLSEVLNIPRNKPYSFTHIIPYSEHEG